MSKPRGRVATKVDPTSAALLELEGRLGEDSVAGAAMRLQQARWKQEYAKRYEIRESRTVPPCVSPLLGTSCENFNGECCKPPGRDHASLWFRGRRAVRFVLQPYHFPDTTAAELDIYCKRWGLRWHADSDLSWHCPGKTLLVEIVTEGEFKDWFR